MEQMEKEFGNDSSRIGAAAVGKEIGSAAPRVGGKGELTVSREERQRGAQHNVKRRSEITWLPNLDLHGDLYGCVEYIDYEQLEMLNQRILLREEMRQPAAEDSSMEAPPDTEE